MQVLNLKNANSLYKGNKEVLKLYRGNNLLYEKLEEIKKYYYTKDSSYINFFSEDFKRKGSIKLPDVLSDCTIEYDFIYNCFVGYKQVGYNNSYIKVVYFTIDILNRTLNISVTREKLYVGIDDFEEVFYIPGGLFKFSKKQNGYYYDDPYTFYYSYKLVNPYDSSYKIIVDGNVNKENEDEYRNIKLFLIKKETNTNRLVICTNSSEIKYDDKYTINNSSYFSLRLIINKNEDKINVEWKEDSDPRDSKYTSYYKNTDDNNILIKWEMDIRRYYNSEKTINNYYHDYNNTNPKINMFECRMIKNNKYYFLNNYYNYPYVDIIDYPMTENYKVINPINCVSNSCEIPIILNNELYSSNFYDKIVKYNEETSKFDLIDNFIDFGTTTSQEFLCFI